MTTEERKRPQSKGSGWIATLGGALLLVAVGFGVGLVAGTAYEEPELVVDHLAGRTTEVVLSPAGEIGEGDVAATDVAAPPPAEPAVVELPRAPLGTGALDETREEQLARAAPAIAPALAVSKPARAAPVANTGSGFAIQVGAFGSEVTAEQLAGELDKRGYRAYVASEGEGARFKVRVGPIASRGEAEQLAERLKREHRLPTWIMAAKS